MKAGFLEDHAILVRYLLGELPEAEQEQVEERYFLDAEYSQLRDEVGMDLVDAYVAGTLTPRQREHFDAHYVVTEERRQAVHAACLSKVYRERLSTSQPARPVWQWFPSRLGAAWVVPALAMGVIAAGILGYWILVHRGTTAGLVAKREASVHATARRTPDDTQAVGKAVELAQKEGKHPSQNAPPNETATRNGVSDVASVHPSTTEDRSLPPLPGPSPEAVASPAVTPANEAGGAAPSVPSAGASPAEVATRFPSAAMTLPMVRASPAPRPAALGFRDPDPQEVNPSEVNAESSLAPVHGSLRRLGEKDLYLQTTGETVLRFRLLAKTQFHGPQGAPIRDSLLHPGDQLSVLVDPTDSETAVLVVLLRTGAAAERESAERPFTGESVRAPDQKDLGDTRIVAGRDLRQQAVDSQKIVGNAVPEMCCPAGVSPPAVIYRAYPRYSEEARKAKVSGSVVLQLVVDVDGRAKNIKVIKAVGFGLDEMAVETVREWIFRPGSKDGRDVPVPATVEVDFR